MNCFFYVFQMLKALFCNIPSIHESFPFFILAKALCQRPLVPTPPIAPGMELSLWARLGVIQAQFLIFPPVSSKHPWNHCQLGPLGNNAEPELRMQIAPALINQQKE